MDGDLKPTAILRKTTWEMAHERSVWMDDVVRRAIPAWKWKLLNRFPSKWLAMILGCVIDVYHEELIAGFGTETRILLNGKVIAKMKFKVKV